MPKENFSFFYLRKDTDRGWRVCTPPLSVRLGGVGLSEIETMSRKAVIRSCLTDIGGHF